MTRTTPLILEKNEGERRVFRGWPGHPDPGRHAAADCQNESANLPFVTASSPDTPDPDTGTALNMKVPVRRVALIVSIVMLPVPPATFAAHPFAPSSIKAFDGSSNPPMR